jgi:riboflavin synthase
MFTGLIEELGTVLRAHPVAGGIRMSIAADLLTGDMKNGDSIAVNGVCLTALEVQRSSFAADVSPETLRLTTLETLSKGSRVNLERSVTPATRLGGHIVQGHVDGRGTFISAVADGDFWDVAIGYPAELSRYLVHKGSVAVEGISLTIAALADDHFRVAVIPKTWEMTNLSTLSTGSPVNLEVDVIAKYVERMLADRTPA